MACQCDPPASPSSGILSRPCTSIPRVLCGFWGLSPGFRACMAVTLINELLFLPPNFLYKCFMKPSFTNWGKRWSFSIFLLSHIFHSFPFPSAPPTCCYLLPTPAGFLPSFLTLSFPLFIYHIISSTWTISSLLPTSWAPFQFHKIHTQIQISTYRHITLNMSSAFKRKWYFSLSLGYDFRLYQFSSKCHDFIWHHG